MPDKLRGLLPSPLANSALGDGGDAPSMLTRPADAPRFARRTGGASTAAFRVTKAYADAGGGTVTELLCIDAPPSATASAPASCPRVQSFLRSVAAAKTAAPSLASGVRLIDPEACAAASAATDTCHSCRVGVIVPGNPGVAAFYSEFAAYILGAMALKGEGSKLCCCYVPSYAGQELGQRVTPPGVTYDLRQQIDHKERVLESVCAMHGGAEQCRIWLVGHSIGSHQCTEVYRRRRHDLPLARCVALFPFMRFDVAPWSLLAHRVLFLLQPLAVAFGGALSMLPTAVLRRIVWAATGGDYGEAAVAIIAEMIHAGSAHFHNCVALGEDEFNTLPRVWDVKALQRLAPGLAFLFAHKDVWGPEEQYKALKSEAPGVPATRPAVRTLAHDFCMHRWMSKYVAEDLVAPLLLEADSDGADLVGGASGTSAGASAASPTVALMTRSRL